MKLASLLALSASFALAPASYAQITCQQVQNLTDAAMEDFASISGDKVSDDIYGASFKLDSARDCQITVNLSATYACIWVYDSLDPARSDYDREASALGNCLGEWDRELFTPDEDDARVKRLASVSFFQEDDDGVELTWIAYLEEHVEGDTHDWHVWVGLDYY